MKKTSLLLAVFIIMGIGIPFISAGQPKPNKTAIFSRDIKKSKHANKIQSLQRGVQYPQQAMIYTWNDPGSNWNLNSAEKYIYYPDGKNMFTYSLATDLSDTVSKETSFFDMYGYSTLEMSEFKTGPGIWQKIWGFRSTYSYFSASKLNSRIEEFWDQSKNSWVMSQKTIYTHNGSGLLTDFIDQDWDTVTSAWINTDKYELMYDGNNKNSEVINYAWDGKAWVKAARIVIGWNVFNPYNVDENNDIDSMEMQEWDSINKQYIKSYKFNIVRDANGGYIETEYDWDTTWVPNTRYTEKYDAAKNYTGSVSEEWNGSAWVKNYEEDFLLSYVSGKLTEKIERYWQQGDPAGIFTNTNKYVFSDFSSMIEKQTIQVKAYPQPFNNYLIIEIPENVNLNTLVLLSDMNGKTMMSQILPSSTRYTNLDVSGLESGFYILNIQSSNSKISKLVIKQ